MASVISTINIQTDAKSWRTSANEEDYWMKRSTQMPTEISSHIIGVSEDKALDFLLPYLSNKYIEWWFVRKNNELNNFRWAESSSILSKLENITQKNIPVETIEIKLTSGPRHSYNAEKRRMMYSPFSKDTNIQWTAKHSIRTVIHETLHMILHYYYQDYIISCGLTVQQFHDLKEAQTVIINQEFNDIILTPDKGYPMHQKLRSYLADFRSSNKNFKEFVDYGIDLIKNSKDILTIN